MRKTLYYAKKDGVTTIWKVPVEGGEERQAFDTITQSQAFTIGEHGVYLVSRPDAARKSSLSFIRFDSGVRNTIVAIERYINGGIAISPDGHWMLYPRVDEARQ